MATATAELNNYRQSPRKVRVAANVVKGKSVAEAKNILTFVTKRATGPLQKLLNSAVANAKNKGMTENLWVKSITVNKDKTLYRRRPVAHGAAHPIHKRTSRVKIVLEEKTLKDNKPAKEVKA